MGDGTWIRCETGGACVNLTIQKLRRQSIADCFPHSWQEVVAVSSRFLSVETSFDFVTGSKWATPVPQRRVRRCRVPNISSLHDVQEISQEQQAPGQ